MDLPFSRRRFLGSALYGSLGIGLSACGGSAFDQDASAPSGPVPEARITLALSSIDQLAADLMQRTGLPGMAVAVVRGSPDGVHGFQTVYAKGFGIRALGEPGAVDADTVFQLASVSKPIGATVVAQQVGLGGIDWNTPVQSHLPWFALADPAQSAQLTIGDLYAHRSGLPPGAGDMLEALGYEQRYVLEHLRYLPLAPLRSRYAYANFGMTAGAAAVAAAAGVDWASLSEQVLYRPLGMSRTSSRFADFSGRSNRAVGHVPVNGKWQRGEVRQPDAQSPAGGASSSVTDMGQWLALLLGQGKFGGRQLVNGAALASALSPQILSAPADAGGAANYYGYGFNVGKTTSGRLSYSHSGAFTLGASTSFMVVPSTGLGIVVLTNGFPIGIPEALAGQFFDYVQYGRIQQDWFKNMSARFAPLALPEGSLAGTVPPVAPAPAQPLAAYTGSYRNSYFGTLDVTAQNGVLVVTVGPLARPMPLRHWDGDLFAAVPPGDVAGSLCRVEFGADQVLLELYDSEGWGTFTR
ncbi:MAG: serine hydrolase [Burkholderiaceae bacterium]